MSKRLRIDPIHASDIIETIFHTLGLGGRSTLQLEQLAKLVYIINDHWKTPVLSDEYTVTVTGNSSFYTGIEVPAGERWHLLQIDAQQDGGTWAYEHINIRDYLGNGNYFPVTIAG